MIDDEEKIRIRTDEELNLQHQGLVELKAIFEELKLTHILSSGTLLGAVRDRDFIRWDWDVQMYLLMEESFPARHLICAELINNGFKIRRFRDSDDALKFDVEKYGAKYELTAWRKDSEWRHRKSKKLKVPAYLFENLSTIVFRGESYPTFCDPIAYLEFCYGDWRTPKRTTDKSVYSTKQHLREDAFFKRLLVRLVNILRSDP